MSEARRCDRCDAFYDDGGSYINNRFHCRKDFCPDCWDDYEAFMDGGSLVPKITIATPKMNSIYTGTISLGFTPSDDEPELPDYMTQPGNTNY